MNILKSFIYLFPARKEKWEIGHCIIDAMNLFDFITLWKFCPEKNKTLCLNSFYIEYSYLICQLQNLYKEEGVYKKNSVTSFFFLPIQMPY